MNTCPRSGELAPNPTSTYQPCPTCGVDAGTKLVGQDRVWKVHRAPRMAEGRARTEEISMSDLIARLSVLEAEQEERAWCVTAETKDQAWRNAESALTEAFSLARQAVAEKDEYKCCANGITLEAATSSESFTDELA